MYVYLGKKNVLVKASTVLAGLFPTYTFYFKFFVVLCIQKTFN